MDRYTAKGERRAKALWKERNDDETIEFAGGCGGAGGAGVACGGGGFGRAVPDCSGAGRLRRAGAEPEREVVVAGHDGATGEGAKMAAACKDGAVDLDEKPET